ncbi:MAG TPA: Mov34/MPN/PAD-1 family protein [Fimbriiglobus sp.]|nr:Mov34/MPN/PAD-1 family protein [Fimbriiglobus sp.]
MALIERADEIRWTRLIRATVHRVRGWADALTGPIPAGPQPAPGPSPSAPPVYGRLRRVVLTDQVSRALFAEYAAHRKSDRGAEETGWVLLGLREADEAVVVATLPAGAERDAGEAHVRFNADAQALASRIVRQADRRLTLLGVVHTHPGRLRHPSHGDYDGDRVWVRNLRGEEGVFGIGTVNREAKVSREAKPSAGGVEGAVAYHPQPHAQVLDGLRFDWYTLAPDDSKYRPVPVELTIGPDLATPLRGVWDVVEEHAARLDRLARQMTRVRFDVTDGRDGPALGVTVGLGEPGQAIRVLVEGKTVRYFYEAGGEGFQADLPAGVAPDQGVYLLLAELAARG